MHDKHTTRTAEQSALGLNRVTSHGAPASQAPSSPSPLT